MIYSKRTRNKPSVPTKQDLINDLHRNVAYFEDDLNWGGSEEGQEKESIAYHIDWIIEKLKSEYGCTITYNITFE
jgi:hypothetical protein